MKIRKIWIGLRIVYLFAISVFELNYVKKTNDKKYMVKVLKRISNGLLKSANVNLTVEGAEHLNTDDRFLLVANHESYFDIVFIYSNVIHPLGFVSKKETTKIPVLSKWMKLMQCVFIDRDNVRQSLKDIKHASYLVENETSICIFPEGTRNKKRTGFKPGSFKIAQKAKAKIIPCTIINSSECFETRKTNKKQECKVVFHKPIEYEDYKNIKLAELALSVEDLIYKDYNNENWNDYN